MIRIAITLSPIPEPVILSAMHVTYEKDYLLDRTAAVTLVEAWAGAPADAGVLRSWSRFDGMLGTSPSISTALLDGGELTTSIWPSASGVFNTRHAPFDFDKIEEVVEPDRRVLITSPALNNPVELDAPEVDEPGDEPKYTTEDIHTILNEWLGSARYKMRHYEDIDDGHIIVSAWIDTEGLDVAIHHGYSEDGRWELGVLPFQVTVIDPYQPGDD